MRRNPPRIPTGDSCSNTRAEQPQFGEAFGDDADGGFGVGRLLPSGDDEFTGAEQQRYHVRLVDPVHERGAIDEAGELLGVVVGPLEVHGDRLEV